MSLVITLCYPCAYHQQVMAPAHSSASHSSATAKMMIAEQSSGGTVKFAPFDGGRLVSIEFSDWMMRFENFDPKVRISDRNPYLHWK